MGKKYTPSGYYIIDLGERDSGDLLVGDAPDNKDDAESLLDILKNKKFLKKPVIISIMIDGFQLNGVASSCITDDGVTHMLTVSCLQQDGYLRSCCIHMDNVEEDATISFIENDLN